MSAALQGKLLRVLQDQEIRPVGGNKPVRVDVRVIAATNKDLRLEIAEGRFRQDLFYRLNVIAIRIPPLRERMDDLPPLVSSFLRRHAPDRNVRIAPEAMERLRRHPWEGNARELENALERALLLCEGDEIRASDLALGNGTPAVGPSASRSDTPWLQAAVEERLTLRQLTELYTARVLEAVRGNKVWAAKILGINRRTLYRRGEAHARDESSSEEEM